MIIKSKFKIISLILLLMIGLMLILCSCSKNNTTHNIKVKIGLEKLDNIPINYKINKKSKEYIPSVIYYTEELVTIKEGETLNLSSTTNSKNLMFINIENEDKTRFETKKGYNKIELKFIY